MQSCRPSKYVRYVKMQHVVLPFVLSDIVGKPYKIMVSGFHVFCRIDVDEKRFTTFGFLQSRTDCIVMRSPDPYALSQPRAKSLVANIIQDYHKRWLQDFVPHVDMKNECLCLPDKGFYIRDEELNWKVYFCNCIYNVYINQIWTSTAFQNCISAMAHLFPELTKCTKFKFYSPDGCPDSLPQEQSIRLGCAKYFTPTREHIIKLCNEVLTYFHVNPLHINAISYEACKK